MDLGLLILRLVFGALFIGHGTQKLFGWFGGHGPSGTGGFLRSLGFQPGRQFAVVNGLAEAGGGLLLGLGLLTPLAAAAIIGVMVTATIAVHVPNGIWNQNGGVEFTITNAAIAQALAFVGPGAYSLDAALGLDLSGTWFGLAALALGGVGALLTLAVRRHPEVGHSEPAAGSEAA
ncbi:MAG TPA: DoxX family protein [Actinomycetota bacterium]|nr:DoxX family protein [Actinomycetota bacterium]